NYAIELKYLGIKKLEIPQTATEKAFEAMSAQRGVLVAEIQSDGLAAATAIRRAADAESKRLLNDAEAQAKQISGEGQAQAAQYLKVFQQNTNLAILLIKLDALKSALGSKATIILGPESQPFDLFKAPAGSGK